MKPQIVIHLDRPLHALLKKAAQEDSRTIKNQAEHIIRSSLAELLASKAPTLSHGSSQPQHRDLQPTRQLQTKEQRVGK